MVNQTEALVAIDVNTGRYVGKSTLEDTLLKVNLDAVREIVRQIRLRDLGGIIVVDFIDMDERKSRQKVMAALEAELRRDRSPTKLLSVNEFGLAILTRKRVRQSLERTLCEPCPYCTGSGMIKSVATVCGEIYEEVKKLRDDVRGSRLRLAGPPRSGPGPPGGRGQGARRTSRGWWSTRSRSSPTPCCTRSSSTWCPCEARRVSEAGGADPGLAAFVQAVEDHLRVRRGTETTLSPRDFALARSWYLVRGSPGRRAPRDRPCLRNGSNVGLPRLLPAADRGPGDPGSPAPWGLPWAPSASPPPMWSRSWDC